MNKNGEVLSEVGVSGATSGFVLLEASDGSFSDAVELVVEIGGQEVYAYTPPVSFCDVDGMYRWRNIREPRITNHESRIFGILSLHAKRKDVRYMKKRLAAGLAAAVAAVLPGAFPGRRVAS